MNEEDPLEIINANGDSILLRQYAMLNINIPDTSIAFDIKAYVMSRMDTDLIIGSKSQQENGAKLAANNNALIISKSERIVSVPVTAWADWRTALPLKVRQTTTIPPRSQSKVFICKLRNDDLEGFANSVKMISPSSQTFGARAYKVAWGPCENPTWLQIANPTYEPIILPKGLQVAELHLGREWKVQSMDLNPTIGEHINENAKSEKMQITQLVRALDIMGIKRKGKKAIDSPLKINMLTSYDPMLAAKSCTHVVDDIVTHNISANKGGSNVIEGRSSITCVDAKSTGPTAVDGNASLTRNDKIQILTNLGVDLQETMKCRTSNEVDLLIDWCILRKNSIAIDGKLDFTKEISHNTTMSIETTTVTQYSKPTLGASLQID